MPVEMIKLNTIWISGILLVLIVGNILVKPENNYETHSRLIEFNIIGLGKILVDDNPEFTSPLMLEESIAELDPGIYYWKVTGLSEIRTFKIISDVGIEIRDKGEKREIRNVGNSNLDLSFRKWPDFSITGSAVLDVKKKMEVDLNNTIVVAKEK